MSLAGTSMGAGGMTTVWRPRVRIEVPEVDDEVEVGVEVTGGGVADEEGHEAEESPLHKGAMRARGEVALECKVCSACPHGRRRQGARSAVGRSSASTVVGALSARSAVGDQSASTVVNALSARSAVGHQSASTVVQRSVCKECGGWINLRARSSAS